MNEQFKCDVVTVIDYLWAEEERDYEERSEGERVGHIFEALQRLESVLNSEAMTVA